MPENNLKVLVTEQEGFIADAKEILKEAIKAKYEGVLVIGIRDGMIHRNASKQKSMAETLGLIEMAKAKLLESW